MCVCIYIYIIFMSKLVSCQRILLCHEFSRLFRYSTGQCRAVFSNLDTSQKPSEAGTAFCQINPDAAGSGFSCSSTSTQCCLGAPRRLRAAHGHNEAVPFSRGAEGSLALLKWHWVLLTGNCAVPRAAEKVLQAKN